MSHGDEERIRGRMLGEQPDVRPDSMLMRLVHMVLIWLMLSLASTILTLATVVQAIVMVAQRQPNARLADFGTDLGIWIAKAARYQTGASDVKPWPWTELD